MSGPYLRPNNFESTYNGKKCKFTSTTNDSYIASFNFQFWLGGNIALNVGKGQKGHDCGLKKAKLLIFTPEHYLGAPPW